MTKSHKNSISEPYDWLESGNTEEILDESMINLCKAIGTNIRYERRLRKFSIEDLAEYLGLSPSYVGLLERGERCPSLKSLMKICELFGNTPNDYLLASGSADTYCAAERERTIHINKIRMVESVVRKLSDSELDFISGTVRNLKNLIKDISTDSNKEVVESLRKS